MSNFQFLESHWTDLAKLGDLSEKYVYSDPNTSIIKQGMLSEVMVKYMLAYDGIAEPAYDNTHANRIRILKNNDLLPREIDNTLYILRKSRNDAAHNAADEGEKALNNLQLMYELCVWYMQTYGDYNYEPTGYVQPVDMTVCLADLEKENAELEERNQQFDAGIIDCFSAIICGDMVEKSKPAPDIYIKACEMLNENPEECIALEDSKNGLLSAYRAGCKPIMVPDLWQPDEEILQIIKGKYSDLEQVKKAFESGEI